MLHTRRRDNLTNQTILAYAGYRHEKPTIDLLENDVVTEHVITPDAISLSFDTSQRYCVGWFNLETGESHTCPGKAAIEPKYDQCPACQRRTGFNPAFYHASSVSVQQDKRNREPHYLYLAYFAPNVIKVGISYAGRNHARLLEQGARAAFVLETFPTALLARQYEAKIASMEGIFEHLTARKKRDFWPHSYTATEAQEALNTSLKYINETLATTFKPEFLDLNAQYFFDKQPELRDVLDRTNDAMISGIAVGCIGTELLVENNDRLLSLNLKHFVGYPVTMSSTTEPIDLPPTQASLF